MMTQKEMVERLFTLVNQHDLWPYVERQVYRNATREKIYDKLLTLTELECTKDVEAICRSLEINIDDFMAGKDVVPLIMPGWRLDLYRRGVGYTLSYKHKDDNDTPEMIKSVFVNCTPEAWCAACMREGANYWGGCCGQTSAMQDIVNGVFRDGGWIEAGDLRAIANGAVSHDGDESPFHDQQREKTLAKDCRGTVWDEMAQLWHLTKDHLGIDTLNDLPKNPDRYSPVELALSAVYGLATRFHFSALFAHEKDEKGQHAANHLFDQAKFLASLTVLYQHYRELAPEPFYGFCVRSVKTKELAVNGYGSCIYKTREDAEGLLELWEKRDTSRSDRKFDRAAWEIVPCCITMAAGLTFPEDKHD